MMGKYQPVVNVGIIMSQTVGGRHFGRAERTGSDLVGGGKEETSVTMNLKESKALRQTQSCTESRAETRPTTSPQQRGETQDGGSEAGHALALAANVRSDTVRQEGGALRGHRINAIGQRSGGSSVFDSYSF